MLLRANKIEFNEVPVSILKGEQKDNPNLPTKTVPTLVVKGPNGDKTTWCQSTAILRYLATEHVRDGNWYSDPKIRLRIDEFFDLFQSRIYPNMSSAIRNRFVYQKNGPNGSEANEPDLRMVAISVSCFKEAMDFFKANYLQGQRFMCGNRICVGDLLAACCLEQIRLVSPRLVEDSFGFYYKKVTSSMEGYDELCKEVRSLPQTLRDMGLLHTVALQKFDGGVTLRTPLCHLHKRRG